jgi:hypothetical protein
MVTCNGISDGKGEEMNDETLALEEKTDILPTYETPKIQVMTETEILSAIQINAGATSWWVM